MNQQSNLLNPAGESWPNDKTESLARAIAVEQSAPLARALVALPRWWFLGILCYAPWAYGSTRPWTIEVLNILLGCCLFFWLLGCLAARQWPRLSLPLVFASAFLITQAGWMTLNAKFIFHTDASEFAARSELLPGAAGSIDQARSAEVGTGAVLLLGALLFVAHCGRDPVWRRRLLFTMAAVGTSLVLFGLVQRVVSAPSIFWGASDTGKTFFATFRYHSNAGAFINLIWPMAIAGLVLSVRRAQRLYVRLAWGIVLALCLVALTVTGARAAGAIAFLFLLASGVWAMRQTRRGHLPPLNLPVAVSAGLLVVILIITAAATAGLDISARRWNKVGELFSMHNPRLLVDDVCLKMIPDAGWFGFGPGTFRRAFPYYTHYLGDSVSGVWLHAHQDYLQTVIEWGYLGAMAWAACIGGALLRAFRFRSASFSENAITCCIVASVVMTLLHALVDFPLQIASLQLFFVTLAGLLWSGGQRLQSTRRRPTQLSSLSVT